MSKPSSTRTTNNPFVSSTESLLEPSLHETPAIDEKPNAAPSPVMKTKMSSSIQLELNTTSTSTTRTQSNLDISESSKTEIAMPEQTTEVKAQWEKFSKNINDSGELRLDELNSQKIQDLAEWLNTSPSTKLKGLSLWCHENTFTEMDYKAAIALAKVIQTNTSITYLDISSSGIDNKTAEYISEAIRANPKTKITRLNLRNNRISGEGAKALANTTITKLDLRNNHIGGEDVKALAEALKINGTITELYLGCNSIDDDGIKDLADSIKVNPQTKITTLELMGNLISDEGTKALAEMLNANTTITMLFLNGNIVRDDGAKALAEMLKKNTIISEIYLCKNPIGNEGVIALAEMLMTNTTITKLGLSGMSILDKGAQALAEALKANKTITMLDLDDHNDSLYYHRDRYKKFRKIVIEQCALNTQRVPIENNIAAALDLLTTLPNPNDGNVTSVLDVNDLIAEKLYLLDKEEKLNTDEVRKNISRVINKYT